MSEWTVHEVHIEAALRRLLPEGDVRDFSPRHQAIYALARSWRYCFDEFGPEHGATVGCLLDLVVAAFPEGWRIDLRFDVVAGVWMLWTHEQGNCGEGTTRVDALLNALENAP